MKTTEAEINVLLGKFGFGNVESYRKVMVISTISSESYEWLPKLTSVIKAFIRVHSPTIIVSFSPFVPSSLIFTSPSDSTADALVIVVDVAVAKSVGV